MIRDFEFHDFGPLMQATASSLAGINVVVGPNSRGKTFLLKALYTVMRAQEEAGRGDDPRDFAEVLSDKAYWVFQVEKLGELVRKGGGGKLRASVTMDDNCGVAFEFGPDTSRKIQPSYNNLPQRDANSVFLPPKEVLSLMKVILRTSLQDKLFGFDATYVDLVLALQESTQKGKIFEAFKWSRTELERMFGGRVQFDSKRDAWVYRKGSARFSVHATAEGIKKVAILDTLLGNRFLSPGSVVFIDEPESALHPAAIARFMEIIGVLSGKGIQFVIATHSYFVLKKLYNMALQDSGDAQLLELDDQGGIRQQHLRDGIAHTDIVKESVALFDEEFALSGAL